MSKMHFLLNDFYAFLIVFARLGGLIFLLPGFAENYVNPRIRVLIALTTAFLLAPILAHKIPGMPHEPFEFFVVFLTEFLVGYFSGILVRIMISSFEMAGALMGYQMNLANAFAEGPASSQQVALPGVFLGLIAVLLIFITDLHHLYFRMFVQSYEVFRPVDPLSLTLMAQDILKTITNFLMASIVLSVQISAPVLMIGLLLHASSGFISRLMPQVQIFFIIQPLQIAVGFTILWLSIGVIMPFFLEKFETAISTLSAG